MFSEEGAIIDSCLSMFRYKFRLEKNVTCLLIASALNVSLSDKISAWQLMIISPILFAHMDDERDCEETGFFFKGEMHMARFILNLFLFQSLLFLPIYLLCPKVERELQNAFLLMLIGVCGEPGREVRWGSETSADFK
jgi:hypothetical protein